MYGSRITRDFGESVPEPWQSAIRKLTDVEIQRGLRRLTLGGSGSTPTLPQFVKACREIGTTDGPENPGPALPKPLPDTFVLFGNHLLFNYLMRHPVPVSDASVKELVRLKDKIIADYQCIHTEDPVTGEEVRDTLHSAWDAIVQPASAEEIAEDFAHFARTHRAPDRFAEWT